MSKFAELPDGTKLEFPDDTEDKIIDMTVKKHLGVWQEPKEIKSDGAVFKDWALDKAGGAVGALSALPDYVQGAVKMAGGGMLQLGGMLSGTNAALARESAGQAMEDILPSFGPMVKNMLPESMQKGAEHGYTAGMYPMELLTEVMQLPGKGVHALTGDKNLQAGTDLAVDLGLLMAPAIHKAAAPKPAPVPEGTKVAPIYGKPLVENGVPKNFNASEVANTLQVNKEIAAELAKQEALKKAESLARQQAITSKGQMEFPFFYLPEERSVNPDVLKNMQEAARNEREGIFRDEVQRTGQGDLIEGIPPYTKEQLLKKQQEADALTFDGPGLAETPAPRATPQEALATNHTNPTIDFPLRQEVLETPEIAQAIEAFRMKDAELSQVVDNAISERVREKARAERELLREEFGRGMEQLGIQNAPDSYGRGLYEARGENTTGTVRHTFNPRSGLSKKQGQLNVAKGQRGSLDIFKKAENKADWEKRMRLGIPDITDQRLNELWRERGGLADKNIKTAKINMGLTRSEVSPDGTINIIKVTPEETLEALKTSEDSAPSAGTYRKTFQPGGYMPMEYSNNPGYKAGIRYLKGLIEEANRKSENALFTSGKGIINQLNKLESIFSPKNAKDILKQMFEAKDKPDYVFSLTPQQMKVKEALSKQFDSMLADINKYLPEDRQLEALPNYIPSIHDGQFYFQVTREGQRPILYGSQNKFHAEAMRKWLEYKGYSVGKVKDRGNKTNVFGNALDSKAANYQYMIDVLTDADPLVRELGKDIVKETERNAYTAEGVNQRFKEYHGFAGELGNNPLKSDRRNYYDAKKMLINSVESHYAWIAAQEAAAFKSKMIESKVPENNLTMLSDYIDHNVIGKGEMQVLDSVINAIPRHLTGMSLQQTRTTSARIGNIITTFKTAMGSPIHAMQNVVQPLTVVFPQIIKEGGSYLDVVDALTRAPIGYTYVTGIKQLGEIGKLFGAEGMKYVGSKEFNKKMQYALDTGVINPTIVDATPMFDTKAANRIADFSMQGVLSRPTEQAARWTVFSTIYDLHVRKGASPEKAAQRAKEITETYMVDYGTDARARVFSESGLIGAIGGRLQTFAMNQMAQTFLYLKEAPRSLPDAMAAVTYLGTLATLGGIVGLPFFDAFEKLVNAYKSSDTETYSLRNELRQSVGDGAIGGAWDKFGLGLAPSFASRTIGESGLPAALGFPSAQILGQALGTAKTALDPRTDFASMPEHEKGGHLQNVTPTIVRGLIEDRFQRKTVKDKEMFVSGKTGMPTHQIRDTDLSFGNIRGSERAKNTDLTNQKFIEETQRREQKQKIKNDISSRAYDMAYGEFDEAKKDMFAEKVQKAIKLGITEQELTNLMKNAFAEAGMGDNELKRLWRLNEKDKTMDVTNQIIRELKYRELRKPQKGIFNFSTNASPSR